MSMNPPEYAQSQPSPQASNTGGFLAHIKGSFQEHPQRWAIGIAAVTAGITLLIYLQGRKSQSNSTNADTTSTSGDTGSSGIGATSGGSEGTGVTGIDQSTLMQFLAQMQQQFQQFLQQFQQGNGNGNGGGSGGGGGGGGGPIPVPVGGPVPAQRFMPNGLPNGLSNGVFAQITGTTGQPTQTLGRDTQWSIPYSGMRAHEDIGRAMLN